MPRSIATCLTVLALVPALAHGATNLISNPRFDAGVAGWTGAIPVTVSWSPLDESAQPASGSLRMSGIAANQTNDAASECFAVTPGAPIVFGASAYSPDATIVQSAYMRILFWSSPDCSGSAVGNIYPAQEDYYAFASTWGPIQGNGAVPAGAVSARLTLRASSVSHPATEVYFDNVFAYEDERCAGGAHVVCLNDRRFRAVVRWKTPDGTRGYGALSTFTGDSARATFFDPANVEVVLKVLDGRPVNDRFWLFAAGLTSVEVKLRVTDTQTGEVWTHTNPLDHAFSPLQDVSAFADEVH